MPPYGYTDDSSFFFSSSSKIQHRAHFLDLWATVGLKIVKMDIYISVQVYIIASSS